MPSYRTILTIGALAPGRAPLDVVRGEPRVTVRFTGADDGEARAVHDRTTAAVRQVASTPRAVLAKVVSGRSVPLA